MYMYMYMYMYVYVKSLWMGRTPWLGDCLQLIGEALINQ